jgi:hypothetical protein
MQNNVFIDSFKTLGANAVPLPFSELFTALETKTVDGQENPFNTILSSKFYEVQKYLTVTNHVYSPWIVLVSKKYWDGLSKASRRCCWTPPRSQPRVRAQGHPRRSRPCIGRPEGQGHADQRAVPAESARMRDKLTKVNALHRRQRRHGPLERDQDLARQDAQVSRHAAGRAGAVSSVTGPPVPSFTRRRRRPAVRRDPPKHPQP